MNSVFTPIITGEVFVSKQAFIVSEQPERIPLCVSSDAVVLRMTALATARANNRQN